MPDISVIVTGLRIARDVGERIDETLPREVLNETRFHVGNGVFSSLSGCRVRAVDTAVDTAGPEAAVDIAIVGPEP